MGMTVEETCAEALSDLRAAPRLPGRCDAPRTRRGGETARDGHQPRRQVDLLAVAGWQGRAQGTAHHTRRLVLVRQLTDEQCKRLGVMGDPQRASVHAASALHVLRCSATGHFQHSFGEPGSLHLDLGSSIFDRAEIVGRKLDIHFLHKQINHDLVCFPRLWRKARAAAADIRAVEDRGFVDLAREEAPGPVDCTARSRCRVPRRLAAWHLQRFATTASPIFSTARCDFPKTGRHHQAIPRHRSRYPTQSHGRHSGIRGTPHQHPRLRSAFTRLSTVDAPAMPSLSPTSPKVGGSSFVKSVCPV